VDTQVTEATLNGVFDYFDYIDHKFSTYKADSEISQINSGQLSLDDSSADMKLIFRLAEQTRRETRGYFDIARNGLYDPSGLVKGWAIYNAAEILRQEGFQDFYVDAGGDIQARGHNARGQNWRTGIRNPFNMREIIKVLAISDLGIATSGTYVRGQHIYNPKSHTPLSNRFVSLTVIGPNIYEADRFATAAFAMGEDGIHFIENLAGFEGYMIDNQGQATLTSGFEGYVRHD
jgi:thiamine biosynthesis lipoprotein